MALGNAFLPDEWRGQGMLALSAGDGLTSGDYYGVCEALSDMSSPLASGKCLMSCVGNQNTTT
jgi:hypothetical protein